MDKRETAFDPFDDTFDQGKMVGFVGGDEDIPVHCHWQVCDVCEGRGSHVHPGIDSHGITSEEMDEAGDDFREDYMSGRYDVPCARCHGRRVMPVPDRDDRNRVMYENYVRHHHQYLAEREAEMRMGA